MDRQCSSCGGFCRKSGCERENVKPEPEPVAWVVYDSESNDVVWAEAGMHLKQNTPLYTAASQRKWQGLTDKEILADDVLRYHFALNGGAGPISKKGLAVIAAVNAKLKEKNNG